MSLPVSEDHRKQQLALKTVMLRELLRVWPALDVKRLDQTFPRWFPLAWRIIQRHHGFSSVVARRYVDEMRTAAGIDEGWTPPPGRPLDVRQVQAEQYRAAVVDLKRALAKQQPVRVAKDRAFVVSAGEATKEALGGGRDRVLDSVAVDRRAVGWYRVTDGDPCYFCAILAARGIRYKSEESASFHPHPSCGCAAAPAYSRKDELPAVSGEAADIYSASTKGHTGKDKIRAFRRAWEARPR